MMECVDIESFIDSRKGASDDIIFFTRIIAMIEIIFL